jgi:stage II sporulation protein D
LLLALSTQSAHAEDLRVRLFSAAPPTEVEVVPHEATLRTCANCKAHALNETLRIVATAHLVHYGESSAAALMIDGRYRLRVNGAPTVDFDAPLEIRTERRKLRIVARLPLEKYVALALGGEAGGIKSSEALKAIAVAIRTYAARFRGRHATEGFDVCDSTHCQVLRLSDTNPAWRAAAEATEGELLWYEGELAYAYHHSSCGGMLEDGRIMVGHTVPYLCQHEDAVCVAAGSDWDAQIEKQDLRRALTQAGFRLGTDDGIAVTDRDRSGRARRLVVDGAPVDATSFRMAVGRELGWNKVRSDLFEVSDQGESVLFRGRGRGHGVGLCQTGAELRGQQGANYREILSFYYPGTTLGLTARGLHWMSMAGERIELQTTNDSDEVLIASGERELRDVERRSGWKLDAKPLLRVYPTVATFRDSTGEPGWVAASTIGRVIRLQPAAVLAGKSALESTLRHELLHMLVEEKARAGTPLWFREGVVLYLENSPPSGRTGPKGGATKPLEERFLHPKSAEDLRDAYGEAAARVTKLVNQHGEPTVVGWIGNGLPAELAER